MIKNCEICGREFLARRSTAKYCSARCRKLAFNGHPYVGERQKPDMHVSMSDEEVFNIVERAHETASDLSRASMLTAAPLCRSLKNVSRKLSDALRSEGL